MRNLKNTTAALMMIAVIMFGTTFANAGIIIAGVQDDPTPCTEKTSTFRATTDKTAVKGEKTKTGIIIAGVTGIIIAGLTGIIIAGAVDDGGQETCGIIIAG